MLKDISPKARSGVVPRARKLRKEMTLPEVLLWRELRKHPGGLKFRRQHGSGAYVLDFFCSDARLAIEVDGFAHQTGNRPIRDEARDAWFARAGITTLRIPASDILRDVAPVLVHIVEAARARLPLHHPSFAGLRTGGPPPRDKLGED